MSGTIRKITSACRATSAAVSQTVACEAKGSGTVLRVFTWSRWPAASRCPAMGAPMMPRPMKPIFCAFVFVIVGVFLEVSVTR